MRKTKQASFPNQNQKPKTKDVKSFIYLLPKICSLASSPHVPSYVHLSVSKYSALLWRIPRSIREKNERPNRALLRTRQEAQGRIVRAKHATNRAGLGLPLLNAAAPAINCIRVSLFEDLRGDGPAEGRESVVGDVGGDGGVVDECGELEGAGPDELVWVWSVFDGWEVPC
jgi:hypothetical protein